MVPAEFMATAVAVLTDAFPQLLYFVDESLTRHLVKVSIHDVAPAEDCLGPLELEPASAGRQQLK
jgi:hypothetical protein